MSDSQYRNIKLTKSIVNQDSLQLIIAEDKDEPFTYIQWQRSGGIPTSAADDVNLRSIYDIYLSKWREIKNSIIQSKARSSIEIYSNFLKQVDLDLTADERRYINNLDYSDPLEVESALTFFVEKVREISIYYSDRRDQIKFETIKNSIKGSNEGVERHLYNQIATLVSDDDTARRLGISTTQRDSIIRDLKIDIEELYDISDYRRDNTNSTYDPYIFIDYNASVQNLLNSYDVTLTNESGTVDIVSNNTAELELQFDVPLEDTSLLPIGDFTDYDHNELNLSNIKKLVMSGSGSKMVYLSSGSDKQYITGTLFDSSKNLQNLYHDNGVNININQNTDTRTEQQLGGFFKPSSLGVLNYYSVSPKPLILDQYIQPDTLYIHPSLESGSNSSPIPVDYYENVSYAKENYLETGTVGEISKNISHIPRFYNYQSSLQTNIYSREGISRKDDNFNFWTGGLDQLWSNSDVFSLDIPNIYKIDERQEALISNKGHAYNWLTDSYGNEYALIKKIRPFSILTTEDFALPEASARCTILDGSTFYLDNNLSPDYTQSVNEHSNSLFENFTYEIVRNGSWFKREACTLLDLPGDSPSNIPSLKGNRVYCSTIDGYIFGYKPPGSSKLITYTDYKQYSSNSGIGFTKRPYITNTWNGGRFNQLCVDAPITETVYKVESSEAFYQDSYEYNSTIYSVESDTVTKSLNTQQQQSGVLYIRDSNSAGTGPFDLIAPRVFGRYDDDIKTDILQNLIEFDVIGSVIIFRTSTRYIFDKVTYNYTTGVIESFTSPIIITASGNTVLSDYFHDENSNILTTCTIQPTSEASSRLKIQINVIDIDTFNIQSTSPEIVNDAGAAQFASDIKKPIITRNQKSSIYYITFLSSHSIGNTFTVCQFSTNHLLSDSINLDMYTSPVAMINTESEEIYPTIDYHMINIDDNGGDYLATFTRSGVNNLSINTQDILPNETVIRLTVDYGDGVTDNINRSPVINYSNFGTAIGSDLQDPRSYLLKHKYTSASPMYNTVKIPSPIEGADPITAVKHTCIVTAYTIEGTERKYNIDVYIRAYDITSHFSSLNIRSTSAYRDKYGNENMLITFISTDPEYITNVILKLNTPVREHIAITPRETSLEVRKDIDMYNISLISN